MTIHFREPRLEDGGRIHRLIERAGTLDLNSAYLYFLLADHFRSTCAIAEDGENLVGFVTAYRLPDNPDSLFVWQIGVDACLLYTSPSPRDRTRSRMPSSA